MRPTESEITVAEIKIRAWVSLELDSYFKKLRESVDKGLYDTIGKDYDFVEEFKECFF